MDVSQMARLVTTALLVATTTDTHRRVAQAVQSLRDATVRHFSGDPAAQKLLGDLGRQRITIADAKAWHTRVQTLIEALPEPALRALVPRAQEILSIIQSLGDTPAEVERFTVEQFAASSDEPIYHSPTPVTGGHDERPPPGDADAVEFRVGLSLAGGSAGQTAAIISLQEEMTAEARRLRGSDHPATLATRTELAHLYWWAGRRDDARETMRQVVSDRERLLGAAHADTLAAKAMLRDWQER
jgi:hypothetical protein